MKTLWLISFAILLSGSSIASASATAVAPENECEGGSQMENAECVGLKLNIADQELNAILNSIRARLAVNAETVGTSHSEAPEIARRLLKSQSTWVAFRQADCSLEGAEMLGGNGEGARIQSCELTKTIERLHELSEASF